VSKVQTILERDRCPRGSHGSVIIAPKLRFELDSALAAGPQSAVSASVASDLLDREDGGESHDIGHAIVTGEPSSKILEACERGAYDLIVMGTHGRGLKSLLLGSTTEWIVRHAACPVLTTRAGGAR
jgi:nucleotide-binding universal stress UspA family protein